MSVSIVSISITLLIVALLAQPMGRYLELAFSNRMSPLVRPFAAVEKGIFRLCGVSEKSQQWRSYALAFLITNTVLIVLIYLIFRFQGWLPLNPSNIGAMNPALAFNTAISFMTNTNLQHYSGESGLSYFSQLFAITLSMFAAPASALALCIAFIRGLAGKPLGNFFVDFLRSITRVLLPISFVTGLVFVSLGVPQTYEPSVTATTITGEEQTIARGPIASFLSIKEVGNNGGGFNGVNSAHPFENPNAISNALQIILMFLLPVALPFTYGIMVGNVRQGRVLAVAMAMVFVLFLGVGFQSERVGNPVVNELGIASSAGNMEGKEVRFGSDWSVFYAMVTTATETGAVNAMHDALTPITGMLALSNMLLNTIFGGVGAGFVNIIMYALIAVFLSGLMIGRTPTFLGKKLEANEMKLIALAMLLQPTLILGASAIAFFTPLGFESISNPGFHGITQVLYEYTSSAANNGSGFEGLGDATPFWDISTGIVMYLGRFLSLIMMLAVAASLAAKKPVPETVGTLQTDSALFGTMFIGAIFIVGALTFFPVLVLGPVAELLTL